MTLLKVLLLSTIITANDNPADKPPVKMEFRPAAEIGSNVELTKGPDGETALQVTGTDKKSVAEIIVKESPAITSHQYVVRGKVKYEDVAGDAYLELWNDFGEKGQYFSRSLSDWGGMKKITGTSKWRAFELPFFAEPGMVPKTLYFNVVMPGKGTITVTEPVVVLLKPSKSMWWTNQQGGLVGGIAGSLFGILGALIGVIAGQPKLRFLLVPLHVVGITFGAISLVIGIVAVSLGQPYHVYYPLLLLGVLPLIILPITLATTTRVRMDGEVRKMKAIDAMGL